MEVIQFSSDNESKLKEFMSQITKAVRPGIFIGFDEDNEPILYLSGMSWKELAYLKTAFDMYFIKDWNRE